MSNEARSDGRREDRYADIIIEGQRDHEHPHATARRVMAVADAEQAEWHRRALAAEEEDHRLTRLLEQRTAALTRTIDAKNAAEAKVTRVRVIAREYASHFDAAVDKGEADAVDAALLGASQALTDALDGGQP